VIALRRQPLKMKKKVLDITNAKFSMEKIIIAIIIEPINVAKRFIVKLHQRNIAI